MFPFMGYGIMFSFIIFIIHMILSLSYFGSLSGSYFVWKSTFTFLFFNLEFIECIRYGLFEWAWPLDEIFIKSNGVDSFFLD